MSSFFSTYTQKRRKFMRILEKLTKNIAKKRRVAL